MKKSWVRLILLLVLAGLGFWGWRVFFPGPEAVIRQRLNKLARTVSFSGNEGNFAKVAHVQALPTFCTPDVEITVDVPGYSRQTISGHAELIEAAGGARFSPTRINVEFFDMLVQVAPDQNSAVADLTARVNVSRDKDFYVQELKFQLKKVEGKWLIFRAETVKTLSP